MPIVLVPVSERLTLYPGMENTYSGKALYRYERYAFVHHVPEWLGILIDIPAAKSLGCQHDKRYELPLLRGVSASVSRLLPPKVLTWRIDTSTRH